jgi:hypothetical protein
MSHFTAAKTRSEATPKEWLAVGVHIDDLVGQWANREDLIVYLGPGAGGNAPACFKPMIAEIEINVDLAFGEGLDPKLVGNLTERRTQFDWPVACGAILHEGMHARHSHWSFDDLYEHPDRKVQKLTELFEESRIEARGVEHYPRNRSFLRACALNLVLGELKPDEILKGGVFGLSQLMLLTLARVDAGVLEPFDVELVREKAEEVLGLDLVEKLREIWVAAQAHREDDQVAPLLKLGERWLELLEDAGHDVNPPPGGEGIPEELAEALGEILGQLAEMAEAAENEAEQEGNERLTGELQAQEVRERSEAATEEMRHRKKADQLFAKESSLGGRGRTKSLLAQEREPTPKERAAANQIGQLLEKAKYHDRVVTVTDSAVPPGRLKMQAVMQSQIERSRGQLPSVRPFRSKRRRHAEDPNLVIGCMVDISGSMSGAMTPMAVTAWLLSEAGRRVQATVAMVYYGQSVFPTLKPGQHLDKVKVYTASDSTEEFDAAFQALDGGLNLLHGSGARLLVIVSDTHYRPDQLIKADQWIRRCSAAGVGVLILTYDSGHSATPYRNIAGVRVLGDTMKPTEAAIAIGQAAAEALEAAGRSRST